MCETLGVLVITVTADDNYSLCKSKNLQQPIQMLLSNTQKKFLYFFLLFWNVDKILNILEMKMTLTAFAFPKLVTANNVVN